MPKSSDPLTTDIDLDMNPMTVNTNKIIEQLDRLLEARNYDLRVQFNETHLDYLADKISDALELDNENRLTGHQLIVMTYNEMANHDLGMDAARDTMKMLNDISDFQTEIDEDAEQAKRERDIERRMLAKQRSRKNDWQGPFIIPGLLTGVILSGMAFHALGFGKGDSGAALISLVSGIIGGSVIGQIAGHKFGQLRNWMSKGSDKKRFTRKIDADMTIIRAKKQAENDEKQAEFEAEFEQSMQGEDAIFQPQSDKTMPTPVQFRRLPAFVQ